ncbi:diacylglycerol kinase [Brachymonas denitrificans]|uniref:diacylglycerol kinase n=1 Tax=Brachymonas denitrificans TaxID=28220 RepID=UPI001F1BBD8B|nr:diacylglycerol kinase [Brachymonas denitrificans]
MAAVIEKIPKPDPREHPQKSRRGLSRLWHATLYSIDGLKAAVRECSAFRMELTLAAIGIPLSFVVGRSWAEVVILAGSLVALMVIELLNSGIEDAIDRISYELHPLAKRAKDFGSAAVFLGSVFCGTVWLSMVAIRLHAQL